MGKRQGLSRGFFFIGLALLAAVAAGWWLAGGSDRRNQTDGIEEGPPEFAGTSKRAVHLYFAGVNSCYLTAEQRIIHEPENSTALVHLLIDLLIEGPRSGAGRTLPGGAKLSSAFILNDGRAVLDFSADAFENLPGGAGAELLAVYSMVNTLVFNVDSVRSISILIGGREVRSLAGHVDIQQPFKANMLWVR